MDQPVDRELADATVRKVIRRFVPFLLICYFVAYLDKVNVGFAALGMVKALGLTPTQFGFGAGIFFAFYAACEVPSSIAQAKVGSRRWLSRIMITWGFVSCATAFVTTAHQFYLVRLLLGVCEAGFAPGMVYFLSLWAPAQYRSRVVGYVFLAIPGSSLLGAPVSGLVLHISHWGLAGWQWLFIIEAIPAVVLGIAMLFWLSDEPAQATWLSPQERDWLVGQLEQEAQHRQHQGVTHNGIFRTFIDPRVLQMVLTFFGATTLTQSMAFWMPQIIKEFGLTNAQTGLVTAIPYFGGAIGISLWSRLSDRNVERKYHAATALGIAVLAFAASAVIDSPVLKVVSFTVAAFGAFGFLPVFWAIPGDYLDRRDANVGIAYITCLGSLAGLYAPWLIGFVREETGSFKSGLLVVAATALVALLVLIRLPIGRPAHDSQTLAPVSER